jgi:acetyl-CoA synthetase
MIVRSALFVVGRDCHFQRNLAQPKRYRGYSQTSFPPRTPILPFGRTYEEIYTKFRWNIPDHYNIGVDICDKHVNAGYGHCPAIISELPQGGQKVLTFGQLKQDSDRLAATLSSKFGIQRRDRVAILLTQTPQTVVFHVAIYKLGAIAIPLFTQFGNDAIKFRLVNSETRALVTDREDLKKIEEILSELPNLELVIVTEWGQSVEDWNSVVTFFEKYGKKVVKYEDLLKPETQNSVSFTPVQTTPDDPALIIFTSGTTGQPKGALHAHRVLLGHLPGVEFPHNLFPKPQHKDLLFYTPADWAWIGGLIDVLLPSLHHGVPVLAFRSKRKFDPEFVFNMMKRHNVRHAFIPPTALKLMRQSKIEKSNFLYSVGSGGESLGEELINWGRETLGLTINEFYGQTEANLLLGNCSEVMPVKPGSMGRVIPGFTVEIISEDGRVLPVGETGNIAVKKPSPVIFLEYWKNPEATKKKFVGEWLLTGDLAKKDSEGYFWFVGRADDVIKCAGYRIGIVRCFGCSVLESLDFVQFQNVKREYT